MSPTTFRTDPVVHKFHFDAKYKNNVWRAIAESQGPLECAATEEFKKNHHQTRPGSNFRA